MKQMVVKYSDRLGTEGERYETRPFPACDARRLAEELASIGCYEFEFVPVKEKQYERSD